MRMLASVVLVVFTVPVLAGKRTPNYPYVTSSGLAGVFYARCIPAEDGGTEGTTTVYHVLKDGDKVVDTYDWYIKRGVVLGWSPIAGKVGIMALGGPPATGSDAPAELSFHLGGKHLASYSIEDLKKLGVKLNDELLESTGPRIGFKVVGCEQMSGTNEYQFVVEVNGKRLSFDILTGKPPVN
jgi:hypothetical protein